MPTRATPGYSGKPVAEKLGIKAGSRTLVVDPPSRYESLVGGLPAGAMLVTRMSAQVDTVHLFVTQRAQLARALGKLRGAIRADAAIWVSWPKKSSKVPTDITEDTIRDVALPLGFVDVKVCAVTEVWSGLRLVIRRELR